MNKLTKSAFALMASFLLSLQTFAQGELIDIDINAGKQEWYENPWVYVGVAAFILILVLIAKRK